MTVFERIENLRNAKGISQGKLEKELGFSNGSISKWKTSMPTTKRLQKLAEYFNVSVEYLMNGNDNTDNSIILNKNDERDISKDLESIMEKLESGDDGPVRFNGQDIDEDTLLLFRQAIELGLTQLKIKNKELYNPNKNKK